MLKVQSRLLKLVLAVTLVLSSFSISVTAAEEQELPTIEEFEQRVFKNFIPEASTSVDEQIITFDVIEKNTYESITLEQGATIASDFLVEGGHLDYINALTATNPDDFYFFSTTDDKSMRKRLISNNEEYVAQLYVVDWSVGQAYPTNVIVPAGYTFGLQELPEGDYAIRIQSLGGLGDYYRISMNAMNPPNYTSILSSSASLRDIVAQYANGDIYSSGIFVATIGGTNEHLNWEREDYFSWGSGYTRRSHVISSVKFSSVLGPVTYSSNYANSDNAMIFFLDTQTLFTYFNSYYQSGPDHIYESTFYDTIGKRTPRRLDQEDIDFVGPHLLVYDLDTNQAIDFVSYLNYFYATGVEPDPITGERP
ncbi:hypothetical protein [Bacillus horti]|uniref:Peptidase C-terminal archaeal/bacterial domain-containing protein n=1 Tax=Caldalkalibacillus horti TaxID=77523 RepID=A0ABT9VZA9_9BACI|nr:hypothetical protein [Bacillus horti]MDQ0166329.1 hypothetical protein [Bacillus horti]